MTGRCSISWAAGTVWLRTISSVQWHPVDDQSK